MEFNEEKKEIYFTKVYDNIEKFGYHTTAVMEEKGFTPFAYSTGIYENFKIPEIFISGLGPNLSGEIIKNYAEKYKFKNVPTNEKVDDLIDTFLVYFINVDNSDLNEEILTTIKFYENRDFKYLQLIFPDLNGFFPNEPNYDYDQKIKGDFKL
ncbi:DUF4262 domain-containing protein [Flavobacterium ajazii]|uniref:DUF4262 domain-containing protein n=1 Tax=Flavobacterium ajazii TaxID=2692318 RepID=UPI0013D09EE4|nr:DUF4262 domain-containing protein [Flavobacterium ajazii]